jgi:hypothetical protein
MVRTKWSQITLVTIWAAVLPCLVFAQNTGVAGDGRFPAYVERYGFPYLLVAAR